MNRNHSVISRLDDQLPRRSSTDTVIPPGGEFYDASELDLQSYDDNRRRRRADRAAAKAQRGLRP